MTRRHPATRAAVAFLLFGGSTVACHEILGIDEFTKGVEPPPTSIATCAIEELLPNVERVDLLFAVDNSRGMGDKTAVLAASVPGLLTDLVNPPCLDAEGLPVNATVGPLDPCPADTKRASQPVPDVHIGVITSSLGDYGGDVCPTAGGAGANPSNDDRAHLLSRGPDGSVVPTYEGMGFLQWDPDSSEPGVVNELDELVVRTTELIVGAGAEGCGYEAQMEAWYRFLVDPSPYDSLEIVDNRIHHVGQDEILLDQREAFLREDSLVVVVMLSDENDCSINHAEGAQGQYMTTIGFEMPRATSVCATAPDDPCCHPCPFAQPEGCDPDPACDALGDYLTPQEDPLDLRCWDQKRRFGVDFLYPPERYVRALTEAEIDPDAADLVPTEGRALANPLFAQGRPRGLVVLAGVVGVPVQTIARRDASGAPDLLFGLDAEGKPVGGFMSPAELTANGVWPMLLGGPDEGIPPGDPYMIETTAIRDGTHPVSFDDMVSYLEFEQGTPASLINGFEYDTNDAKLQYACIHPIGDARDCSISPDPSCCEPGVSDPTCQDMANPLLQTFSPARPAVRELEVMRALEEQAALGSVCRLGEPDEPNFGYTPVLASLADRLQAPIGSRCLTQAFPVDDPDAAPPCVVVEARVTGACDCPAPARAALGPLGASIRDRALADAPSAPWSCFCEIPPVAGLELALCLDNPAPEPTQGGEIIHGWCYIDGNLGLGDPSLADACASRRQLRLLGDAQPAEGATLLVGCETNDPDSCGGAP